MAAAAGLPAALSRFTAELLGAGQRGTVRDLLGWTLRIEAVAAVGAAAVPVVAAVAGADPAGAWILAGVGAGLAVVNAVPAALLRGAQRWRDAVTPGLVTGLVALPATWLALERGGGITEVIAVETTMIAVNLMWTALLARRVARRLGPSEDGTTGATAELRRRFVRFAWGSTVLVGIQLVVWRRSELFVLEWLSEGDQIARYSIAFALVWGLSRTVGGVATVVAPAVASLVGSGALHRAGAGFWRMCRLLLVLGPAAAAATVALGPPLVRLAYGEPYADVGPVIVVMAVPLAVLPVLTAAEAALLGLGRVRFVVITGLTAAVVDVGVAVALVPGLGAIGAAVANGAAQLVAGVPAVIALRRAMAPVDVRPSEVARSVVAAAVAGGTALTVVAIDDGAGGVTLAVAAGLAVWALAIIVLRPLRSSDLSWLAGAVRPRRAAAERR